MLANFYSLADGARYFARVSLTDVAGSWMMQVVGGAVEGMGVWDTITTPRYVANEVLERIRAGIRPLNRMPAWMLADVLEEQRVPAWLCEIIRESDLQHLRT